MRDAAVHQLRCADASLRHHNVATDEPKRILVVEDDPTMRHYVDHLLREFGYVTVRAMDGKDALELCEGCQPFDLLLTDLVMPRMDGIELARRMRQTNPTLKVLYFTGFSDRLFVEKGTLWEDEAFLEKPSSVEGLIEAVSMLLGVEVPRRPKTRLIT